MNQNRITRLLGIEYPIIQAGMIWASGWRLASAVSNAGGLGLIGAGSMYPDILREHIQKCKAATDKPFGVNVPLLYPNIEEIMNIIIEEHVPIVFTSAGNPKTWTGILKEKGIKVVHVVSSAKFALKCQDAGCDAVVAEGFEAGGHNGREETTTMCLIPSVRKQLNIPLIAAGGIYDARTMLAAMVLGADAVQIGSRFVATSEASSHLAFKEAVVNAREGDTLLSIKKLTPVRLLNNSFAQQIQTAEKNGASNEELEQLLGRARAKKGMFEGDMTEGELEIGQVSALIDDIIPAGEIVANIMLEFNALLKNPLAR
jgi:enoyl-[acyl-carrier protein] reductase II